MSAASSSLRTSGFSRFGGTLGLSIAALGMLALFIVRVPTWMADVLILINFGFSVVLLAAALQVQRPSEYAVLPSILLISTFYRLAISLATTRLVLLDGDAGHVIETFGEFLLGGSVVVGLVVFLIVTVVQFIVITKGAERVAEVSARFSLDALPGQQMSIEADLRAGLIDGEAAARQRAALTQESRFFGALDGAMKFVKGDAIAGMVIVFVNLLGGMAIGAFVHGMSLADSAARFMVLSIGDGMVAQIPSIVAALSCSIIITRVSNSTTETIASDMWHQVMNKPGSLAFGAIFILGFAAVPGMPIAPAVGLAVVTLLFIGVRSVRQKSQPKSAAEDAETPDERTILLRIGAGFDGALRNDNVDVSSRLEACRSEIAERYGVRLPRIGVEVVADKAWLLDMEFESISLASFETGIGAPAFAVRAPGVPFAPLPEDMQAPCHGLVCFTEGEEVESLQPLAAAEALLLFVSRTLVMRLPAFFDLEMAKKIESSAKKSFPEMVGELQRILPSSKFCEILRVLLADGIPVAPIRPLIDQLIKLVPKERDTEMLAEYLRVALGAQILREHATSDGLCVAVLDPRVEDFLRERIRKNVLGTYVEVEGDDVAVFETVLMDLSRNCLGGRLMLMVHIDLRAVLKSMLVSRGVLMPVLSIQEVPVSAPIKLDHIVRLTSAT